MNLVRAMQKKRKKEETAGEIKSSVTKSVAPLLLLLILRWMPLLVLLMVKCLACMHLVADAVAISSATGNGHQYHHHPASTQLPLAKADTRTQRITLNTDAVYLLWLQLVITRYVCVCVRVERCLSSPSWRFFPSVLTNSLRSFTRDFLPCSGAYTYISGDCLRPNVFPILTMNECDEWPMNANDERTSWCSASHTGPYAAIQCFFSFSSRSVFIQIFISLKTLY